MGSSVATKNSGALSASSVFILDDGGFFLSDNTEDVLQEVGQSLSAIDLDITNINNSISNIQTDITGIELDITNIQADITNIQTDISDIQNIININGYTSQSVLFAGAGGEITEDAGNFIYDSSIKTLTVSKIIHTGQIFQLGTGVSAVQQVKFHGAADAVLGWNPTAVRIISLPDASGTVALTSNLSAYLPLTGGTLTGGLRINYNSTAPLLVYNTAGTTMLAEIDTAGQLELPTQGPTGGIKINDVTLYRPAGGQAVYSPYTIRGDGGIAFGGYPTTSYFNYFSKTNSANVISPSLFFQSLTIADTHTGSANIHNISLNINITGGGSSSGAAALFGFANAVNGNMSGSLSGLRFFTRDSRPSGFTSTTGAGIDGTFQINSTCGTTYSNATYGILATYADFSSTGSPTVPWAVIYGTSDLVGNLTVTNFKAGMWLNFNQTFSAKIPAHYGIRIENVKQGVLNYAISMEGTGLGNGLYFNGRQVVLYSNVLNLKTDNNFELGDGKNIVLQTTTGTKIGTATTQKLGFWNTTPVVQPSGTGEATGHTAGAGAAVDDQSTFTGNTGTKAYTLNDVIKHLKLVGLLATS